MNLPLAPAIAGVVGGAVALCALAVPAHVLEGLVMSSGLPAILTAAEPPLGLTARALFAFGIGGGVGAFAWFALSIVLGARAIDVGGADSPDRDAIIMPVLRRADAHPDAPPRPPLLATRDLGRPFDDLGGAPAISPVEPIEEVGLPMTPPPTISEPAPVARAEPVAPIEQPLPRDLDQPLAAFDPDAVPDVPLEAPVALPPLSIKPKPPVFESTERFETFELPTPIRATPPAQPAPRDEAITRPETEASVHALLERLERGVARKAITPRRVRGRNFVEQERNWAVNVARYQSVYQNLTGSLPMKDSRSHATPVNA